MRHAVLSDGDELPIDHGVAFDAFESLGDLDVGAADDLSVAAVERDAPVPDLRDHPEAVVLILEDPVGIVKGCIREGGEHWLQTLGQCGLAAHCRAERGSKNGSAGVPARFGRENEADGFGSRRRPIQDARMFNARVRTETNPFHSFANHGIVRSFGFTMTKAAPPPEG